MQALPPSCRGRGYAGRVTGQNIPLGQRSDGDRRPDGCVRGVTDDLEVLEAVVEDRIRLAVDHQRGQRARLAGELQLRLLQVVVVQVHVAADPHELADGQVALLRD